MGRDKSDTTGVGGRDLPDDDGSHRQDEAYRPGGRVEANPDPEEPGGNAGLHHPPTEPERTEG